MGKGGMITLFVNGEKIGRARAEKTARYKYSLHERSRW
jgi:hypothetical protein